MIKTFLVLKNSYGGELDRREVSNDAASELASLLLNLDWTIDVGDNISVEDTWTED